MSRSPEALALGPTVISFRCRITALRPGALLSGFFRYLPQTFTNCICELSLSKLQT
jgi:hypothetical protein